MPLSKVILRVAKGNLKEREYVFSDRTHCILGRAQDCDIQVPLDQAHADVSRHHCLFDLDPPAIRVRDLGSRNGTYVNGEIIGQRPAQLDSTEGLDFPPATTQALKPGDVVRVGSTVIRVDVDVAIDGRELFSSPLDSIEYP